MDNLAKNKIMKTTIKLVNTYGLYGFPITKIAKEAGLSVGTIYHYFSSKEQLLQELYRNIAFDIQNRAARYASDANDNEERFCYLWKSLFMFWIENPAARSFIEQVSAFPKGDYPFEIRELYPGLYAFFLELVEDGRFEQNVTMSIYKMTIEISISYSKNMHAIDVVAIAKQLWRQIEQLKVGFAG